MGSSGAHPIAITAWTSVIFAAIVSTGRTEAGKGEG